MLYFSDLMASFFPVDENFGVLLSACHVTSDRCGKKFNQKGDLIVFMPRGTKRVGHLG